MYENLSQGTGLRELRDYKVNRIIRQTIVRLSLLLLCFSGHAYASLKLQGDSFSDASIGQDGLQQLHLGIDASSPLTLTFETTLKPFIDEQGGYGSELYADLSFFRIDNDAAVGSDLWIGWQNRYDVEAIRVTASQWNVSVVSDPGESRVVSLSLEAVDAKDAPVTVSYFQGARDRGQLREIGLEDVLLHDVWQPFRVLCLIIWSALLWLHSIAGSWGIALLLLALVVRILIIPITRTSLEFQRKAIEQQNRMASKVADLKRNATGLELSEKMVALYESEGYDHLAPFKGMLGLFIQIPILIALFTVIGEMSVLREQQFLWISDLSLSDRIAEFGFQLPFFGGYFNLLPCLMALVTVLSTWVAGYVSKVEVSAGSLYGMALVFFVFFYSFPAALVLYWFASNFFQLLQQLVELFAKR